MSNAAARTIGPLTRLRPPKTAELVADHLRRQIIRGELSEGQSLPSELALTERYGVSRPTLREAFRVLEAEQLITVRRGARGGAVVHEPSAAMVARYAGFVLEHMGTTLADILEARLEIEGPCARLAAERRSEADVIRLRAAVATCEMVGHDRRRFVLESSEFHGIVVETARNKTLALMYSAVGEIIAMANVRRFAEDVETYARANVRHHTEKTHSQMVDHIEAGDADAADDLWRRHLTATNSFLLELPESGDPVDLD